MEECTGRLFLFVYRVLVLFQTKFFVILPEAFFKYPSVLSTTENGNSLVVTFFEKWYLAVLIIFLGARVIASAHKYNPAPLIPVKTALPNPAQFHFSMAICRPFRIFSHRSLVAQGRLQTKFTYRLSSVSSISYLICPNSSNFLCIS